MVKLQTLITNLLLISSIAAVTSSRSTTLSRRGLSANCDPLLGDCGDDQWPNLSPITSSNPFISRPFLRRQTPPYIFPSEPPSVVVPSPPPPPPVFTNPSFTLPPDDTNPSFSPLVASPPPPGETIPSVFPELPPADDDGDSTNAAAPPFFELSFSPPADDSSDLPPEATLPPIVDENQPDVFMSPPQQNWPAPDVFNVPPPPLVPVDSDQPPEDAGQLPLQQPEESVMPPPVDENARKPPPVVQSPPSA